MAIPKRIEIFCGTGGVGKTTLAASRALFLALSSKKILLITIDPARRLKQVMGLSEEDVGVKKTVALENGRQRTSLDVLLFSPEKSFAEILRRNQRQDLAENRILKILVKPFGGLNEILSSVELSHYFSQGDYDTIVLDTPPGSHFLDFLDSAERIQIFFDNKFVEIFNYLVSRTENNMKLGILKKLVVTGMEKLLQYLKKVTGEEFLNDFINSVSAIYLLKDEFLQSLQLQRRCKNPELSNWFLVTSVEQSKTSEAMALEGQGREYFHSDSFMLLNRCQKKLWEEWRSPVTNSNLEKMKEIALTRETNLAQELSHSFARLLTFTEVGSDSPLEQIFELSQQWDAYAN